MKKVRFFLIIIILILFIISLVSYFLRENKEKSNDVYYIESYKASVSKYQHLIGDSITSLPLIIDENSRNETFILYLFAAGDCDMCISRGFSFLKDSLSHMGVRICVVSDNASISSIQDKNNYTSYVYIDDSGLIRRELKYCLTPVFFLLDSCVIKQTYFPKNVYDVSAQLEFLKAIKQLEYAGF